MVSRLSTSTPPVGKSGPVTKSISARSSACGLSIRCDRRLDQLADIVRRDAGRHADRDPAGAIGQQIGEQAGEDLRLLLLAIIGRLVIDRAFVEPGHQPLGGPRQPRLGVAVGGGIIPVDIAEIALPVDQRIAQRPFLRQPHHRVIDRLVAMRMILADHVADDAGAFLVGRRPGRAGEAASPRAGGGEPASARRERRAASAR